MSRFVNHYLCPECGLAWEDEWDCQCDDDCPSCGCRHVQPDFSEDAGPEWPTELTEAGEQTVIPGCERNASPKLKQLNLFG